MSTITYQVYIFFSAGSVYSLIKETKERDVALSIWQTELTLQPYDIHVVVSQPDKQVIAFYSPWIGKFGDEKGQTS